MCILGAGAEFTPKWRHIDHKVQAFRKYARTKHSYTVQCTNIADAHPTEENMTKLVTSLVDDIAENVDEADHIGLAFTSPSLDYPITLPYTKFRDWNAEQVFRAIQGTLNSNQDFRIDKELKIELTHVVVPEGSGYPGKHYYFILILINIIINFTYILTVI